MAFQNDEISINTMIGTSSFVTGNLQIEGFVRIDGSVNGNIETSGKIIIGENAKIRGNVNAKSVIAGGIIEGDIVAPDFIQLLSSAVVLGDIVSKKIRVEEKAIIQGYCISVSEEQEFEQVKNQWVDRRAITDKNVFGKKDE